MASHTTVSIPKPLYEKTKKIIENSGFTSVSDFVTFILREIIADMESNKGKADKKGVIERLRALGYIE